MAATTDTVSTRRLTLVLVIVVAALVLVGVGVFKFAGHVAYEKAAAIGEAVVLPGGVDLYDQTQIAAKATRGGVGVVLAGFRRGRAGGCAFVDSARERVPVPARNWYGSWVIGDEPCDGPSLRGGVASVPADERASAWISDPQSWADADNPLIAVGSGSQATGYGDVYVQNEGPDDVVAVTVTGFNRVSGEPGPKAYFKASVWVRCQPIEGCQYREVRKPHQGAHPHGRSLPRQPSSE